MRNQEKVIVIFCINMIGWCILLLPTLPGDPKPASWQFFGFAMFNIVSAIQCHFYMRTKR